MDEEQTKDVSETPAPDVPEDVPAVTVEGELQALTAERDRVAALLASLNSATRRVRRGSV